MSMSEALKKIRGASWLNTRDEDTETVVPPKTPTDRAQELIWMAKGSGELDRTSSTWIAIARWAATELLSVHIDLETATGERADALRSRAKTLRDVLAMGERETTNAVVLDSGPYVP